MILTYLVISTLPSASHHTGTSEEPSLRQQILECLQNSKIEVARGSTHLARELLERAIQLRDAAPDQLTEAEHRELNQTQRQVALLTDLAPGGLTAMLEQAERAPTSQAWQARFRAEYLGRGVILDDVLRRPRNQTILGRVLSDLRQGPAFGRVVLDEVQLLQELPLQEPQRWIVGARVKSVDREGRAVWVIRLEPDSGVLFTEPALLPTEMPTLREDPEWPMVQQRQRALLETLPTPRPHR
jgi:hypothetical protein